MAEKRVLGVRVDSVGPTEAVDQIIAWGKSSGKCRMVSTAYSEFFVTAMSDVDFRMALESSDLVTPDGIGPLAAIYFESIVRSSDSAVVKFFKGLQTGLAILTGRVGQPVSGYWLFKTLVEKAVNENLSVFLLGGFGETAERLAEELRIKYRELRIMAGAGAQSEAEMTGEANERVTEKINKFKPDLLFVAYGPVKQEKWLKANRNDLKARVAVGVGGTFDEALGLVKEAPVAFSKYGLKWLWRLLQQPRRLPRIFKATFVFAWLVFVNSLKKK